MFYLKVVFLVGMGLFSLSAAAEPVAINQATGQGYVFNHAGNCYVVFPGHVVKGRLNRTLTLTTAAPLAAGDATKLNLNTVHDLSIAYVSQGFENRCTDGWSLFSQPVAPLLSKTATGSLLHVTSTGVLERLPVKIRDFDLDFIYADVAGGGDVAQGYSGGFLTINDQIVGMLLQTTDGYGVKFLRVDEIQTELKRLVETGVVPNATAPGVAASCPKSAVPLKTVICDREAVNGDFACSKLVSGRPLLIPSASLPVTIYAELNTGEAKPVSRIALRSIVSDENAVGAKSVRVMVDSSSDSNAPYWRFFGTGDMPPTGAIDLNNGSQPYVRRVKVTIDSSWSGSKPVNLSCLSVL